MRPSHAPSPLALLLVQTTVLTGTFAAVAWCSGRFAPGTEPTQRPIIAVLALLAFAFFSYLLALCFALRVRNPRHLVAVIIAGSILFRAASLFSWPILEIDIYRYIWDGAVTLSGTSPYRYSPEQVLRAGREAGLSEDLRRLARLRRSRPAMATVLERTHYEELPTVYPPVSQAVFAMAVAVTPPRAGVFLHVLTMKATLVLFDLATIAVVIGLLRVTGRHVGWTIAYAWCPLVIKEIANSGHLDSVPGLFATLALYMAVRPLAAGMPRPARCTRAVMAAVLLALGVGAKLYPVVLFPLLMLLCHRVSGWRWTAAAAVIFWMVAAAVLWPMAPRAERPTRSAAVPQPAAPPPPADTMMAAPQDPSAGLKAFFRRWEMNDLLFLVVVENLKPQGGLAPEKRAWFSVVPEPWKTKLLALGTRRSAGDESVAPFLLARVVTTGVFLLIAAWLAGQSRCSDDPAVWLRAAFLTVAWFWLLSPTQNPWYWMWALPMVTFARSRVWLAVSGLTMVYYLRFWLVYHWPDRPLLGTPYPGAALFDLMVTWFEFGPWLLWLAGQTIWKRLPGRARRRR